jgi:hypothetical protein
MLAPISSFPTPKPAHPRVEQPGLLANRCWPPARQSCTPAWAFQSQLLSQSSARPTLCESFLRKTSHFRLIQQADIATRKTATIPFSKVITAGEYFFALPRLDQNHRCHSTLSRLQKHLHSSHTRSLPSDATKSRRVASHYRQLCCFLSHF